jgi:hypothetical protein
MKTSVFNKLYRTIDDEARRAVTELLARMAEQLSFELGRGLHIATDDVTVFLQCVRTDQRRCYYAGVVLAGFPAGREVVGIPWALWSGDGREIGRGVTATGGHFGFAVAQSAGGAMGRVELRFGGASQVSAEAEEAAPSRAVPFPVATGQAESAAWEYAAQESAEGYSAPAVATAEREPWEPAVDTRDAAASTLEIANLLEAFRQANAGEDEIRPVAAPALRRLDEERFAAWRWAATTVTGEHGALSAHTNDEGPQPAEEVRGIRIQGDEVVVRYPAEQIPYGVVRILAKQEELLVGTCLLPVLRYGPVCSNLCPAVWVVGERDPRTLNWYVQPANQGTLPWFPAREVAALLERADVRGSEELSGQVHTLLELAREREEERHG